MALDPNPPEVAVPGPDVVPRLDGVHHIKLPVSDLTRSRDWYDDRLGYADFIHFTKAGSTTGISMVHPNGGPMLGLVLDPDRARRSAGFDYFSIGVPTRTDLEDLAAHLTAAGEDHAGVHFATIGWILPDTHDPDGHEVRFYAHDHHTEVPADALPLVVDDPIGTEDERRRTHEGG